MEKIPTAEELLCRIPDFSLEHCKMEQTIDYQVVQKLREFAKLHVQEALKTAAEKALMDKRDGETDEILVAGMDDYYGYEGYDEDHIRVSINKPSILDAYPLNNIKI